MQIQKQAEHGTANRVWTLEKTTASMKECSIMTYRLNDANSEPGRIWDRKQGVEIRENNSKCERMWTGQRHSRVTYQLNDANSEPGRAWDRK